MPLLTDQQQRHSIDVGLALAAYCVVWVGSGQRCCWPLKPDPMGGRVMGMREQLEAAQRGSSVVCVGRDSFESEGELGFIIAVNADLVLLLCVSNQIRLDGFAVVRICDISGLEAPHAHDQFVEEALRLRGEAVPDAPEVDITSIGSALRAAGKLHSVLAVHREEVESEVCHVGAVVSVSRESIGLLEIGPDADWDEEPTTYALSEITRIDFGGGYEEALALVGGHPPAARHLRPVS